MNIRKLTILHSNDPHGAFLPREKDGRLIGGISMLAGKLEAIRKEEENCLYAIAGDLFKGSLIDAEFKGISTIEMINLLRPDVVTIGNHEVDYGLAHLLFLEKCARFPLINANMFISDFSKRLFEPCKVIEVNGLKVLFIGLVTSEILMTTKGEELIGSYLDVDDHLRQINTILDSYKTTDIDLTVLLTHIGYEEDRRLAQRLEENSGIDIIIGAHSHTLLVRPKVINDIPIVQVGSGFEHLGRFDISIDTDTHKMIDYSWKALPIDSDNCRKDQLMEEVLNAYGKQIDEKSSRILTTFKRRLDHHSRHEETPLSNLFADLMQKDSSFDIMMLGTGSFRGKGLGPVVDYRNFKEVYPFDNRIYMLTIEGKTFRKMCHHFLKQTYLSKGSEEFYAFSKGMELKYDANSDDLITFRYNGKDIQDDQILKIGLPEFHFNSCEEFLNVTKEELSQLEQPRIVVNSDVATYEEMLKNSFELDSDIEGRVLILQ